MVKNSDLHGPICLIGCCKCDGIERPNYGHVLTCCANKNRGKDSYKMALKSYATVDKDERFLHEDPAFGFGF